MIEQFSREDFETFLTSHSPFDTLGLVDGEYTYQVPLDNQTSITIRSSIKSNGLSADIASDSIRAWLVSGDKPLGVKTRTHRQPGWQDRLTDKIKQLILWRTLAGDCKECGRPKGIFKARTEANKGRSFAKCKEHNGFVWLDEPVKASDIYFSEESHGKNSSSGENREQVAHAKSSKGHDRSVSSHDLRESSKSNLPQENGPDSTRDNRALQELPAKSPNVQQKQAIEADINANLRVLAAPGSGKCVKGDSLVLTTDGFIRIEDCHLDYQRTAVDHTMSLIDPSHWHDMGVAETIKITTQSGYEIEGTPEHPVQVLANDEIQWKRLDEIAITDNIILAWNTQQFGVCHLETDPDLPYIMGNLIADGNVGGSGGVGYVGLHRSGHLANTFKSWAEVQGLNIKTHTKKNSGSESHIFHAKYIVDQLVNLDYPVGKLARDKEIPGCILRGTKKVQREFLQGYFDLESHCSGRNIEVITASKKLGKQIQIILLNFGIRISRKPKFVPGYNHTYWRLSISGDALRSFAKQVGYKYATAKQGNLEQAISYNSNPNKDVFPLTPYYFRSIREKYKNLEAWKGHEQYAQLEDGGKLDLRHYLKGDRNISRNKLKIISETTMDSLAKFLSENILIDQADSVQTSEAHVYDFTIPKTHSFVANGFVNHNTFIIEHRYKFLVDNGIDPDKIIVCTFGKQAATDMGQRIIKTCPQANLEQICTINALCYRLLAKWYPDSRWYQWRGPKDWQIKKTLEDVIGPIWRESEKPSAQETYNYVNTSKYLGLTTDDSYTWFVDALGQQRGAWLYEIRSKFDAWLNRNRFLTFADQLFLTEQQLRNDGEFRAMVQGKFSHVIVDEGQDCTAQAIRILVTISLNPGDNML